MVERVAADGAQCRKPEFEVWYFVTGCFMYECTYTDIGLRQDLPCVV